ncbi:UNVERIFIED_CONTAM: hypothetical protein FKN15_055138 [Acipenser sinensis]
MSIFQQENARPHSARITIARLQENNIEVLPWPAFSPDLSPIEHLWDQIASAIYSCSYTGRVADQVYASTLPGLC